MGERSQLLPANLQRHVWEYGTLSLNLQATLGEYADTAEARMESGPGASLRP